MFSKEVKCPGNELHKLAALEEKSLEGLFAVYGYGTLPCIAIIQIPSESNGKKHVACAQPEHKSIL